MQITEFYGTLICKLLMFNEDKHVYTVNVGGSNPSSPTSLHLGKAEISPRQAVGADERTRLARRSAKHEDGTGKTAAA